MSSQDTPSADVLSLISDMTKVDEVSGDVNVYFQKVTSPETGKAVLHQCIKAARDILNKPYKFEVELVSAEED